MFVLNSQFTAVERLMSCVSIPIYMTNSNHSVATVYSEQKHRHRHIHITHTHTQTHPPTKKSLEVNEM